MPELLDVRWLVDHYAEYWGHPVSLTRIKPPEVATDMWVAAFPPLPGGNTWIYATVTDGSLQVVPPSGEPRFELFIKCNQQNDDLIDLLVALSEYSSNHQRRIGPTHTIVGDTPVVTDSPMQDILLAPPLGMPPDFAFISSPQHIHLLMVVPIHRAERELKVALDWRTLWTRFIEHGIDTSDLFRSSVA